MLLQYSLSTFFVISIIIGFGNLITSYLINLKYQNNLSKYYFIFVVCLFIDNSYTIIYDIFSVVITSSDISNFFYRSLVASNIIVYIGYIVVTVFISSILFKQIRISKLYTLLLILFIGGFLLLIIISSKNNIIHLTNIIIYLAYSHILSMIITSILNLNKIKNIALKSTLKKVLIILIILFPLLIGENILLMFNSNLLVEDLIGSLIFLLLSLFGIIYSIKYLFKNNYEMSNFKNTLSDKKITKREEEVINLVLLAYTNSSIAESLFISEGTVKNHLYNIYRKLSVKNRLELLQLLKS